MKVSLCRQAGNSTGMIGQSCFDTVWAVCALLPQRQCQRPLLPALTCSCASALPMQEPGAPGWPSGVCQGPAALLGPKQPTMKLTRAKFLHAFLAENDQTAVTQWCCVKSVPPQYATSAV